MNKEEFMEQQVKDMTIKELREAIEIKEKDSNLSFAEEIKTYPGRFEKLVGKGWEKVLVFDGVSKSGTARIINNDWNNCGIDGIVLYVEFVMNDGDSYKEIIRRIQ